MPLARSALFPEILAPGNFGEIFVLTAVPGPDTRAGIQIEIHFILDIKAIASRADIRAISARNASGPSLVNCGWLQL